MSFSLDAGMIIFGVKIANLVLPYVLTFDSERKTKIHQISDNLFIVHK